MSGSRLFTIVASKNGFETVVCQEDAGNEADALKLAIGRLPVEFVEDGDLVGIGANFDGSAELVMLKTTRIHNVWSWPQAESLGLSFRVVIVDTRN